MQENLYEILATIMRYVFLLAMVYILLKVTLNVWREFRMDRRSRRRAGEPPLGYIMPYNADGTLGHAYPLKWDTVIGSARYCDIRIDDTTISRTHAQIFLRRNTVYLLDLGSKYGIALNGEDVSALQVPLYDGDDVVIGGVAMHVTLPNFPQPLAG